MGDSCSFALYSALDTYKSRVFNDCLLPSTHHPSDLPTSCDIQIAGQVDASNFKPSHIQSPFDSLPNELISLILERGYLNGTFLPDTLFRSSIARISHRFRQISLHTPSLWSIIRLTPGNIPTQATHLIPLYLTRSMDYPLSIELTLLSQDMTIFVMQELVPHSKRWRHLSITIYSDHTFSFIQHIPVPLLEYLSISYFSSQRRASLPSPFMADCITKLSFLSLRNVDLDNLKFSLRNIKTLEIRGYGRWPSHPHLTSMLESSQSLESLILHVKPSDVLREIEVAHYDQFQILLPHLRNFVVYTSEWLTDQISILIRLFTCPKLQTLVVLESTTSHMIMSYDVKAGLLQNSLSCSPSLPNPHSRSLVVRSADIYLSCLSVPSSTLTTLELHKVIWPIYALLKETFGSLKQLQHLLISSLNPGDALIHIMDDLREARVAEVDSSILVPSLITLTIEFGQTSGGCGCADHTVYFLRLFSLPRLASLNLRHVTFHRWKSIMNSFAVHSPEYSALTSLTLSDMIDVIATTGEYRDPSEAFPFLKRLSLDRIYSNAFIQHLFPLSLPLNGSSDPALPPLTIPWPCLRTLSVTGDANVSKPLLGHAITTRERLGVPFDKVYLDHHLTMNTEFWDWVTKKVDVELVSNSVDNWWFHLP